MSANQYLVVFIVLVVAAVFIVAWQRRDAGAEPVDTLADTLHEPVDGHSAG